MRALKRSEAREGRATESPGPSRLLSLLGNAAVITIVGAAAAMLVPAALGYERYVITGGSMGGTYDRGSIVYSEVVPIEELTTGDVITFDPPGAAGGGGFVTHRIISIAEDSSGGVNVRTKGDANASRDPGLLRLEGPGQPRAVASIPYAGYAFAALSIREVRVLVIGLPASLIAFFLIAGLWRDAGREASQATTGDPDTVEA